MKRTVVFFLSFCFFVTVIHAQSIRIDSLPAAVSSVIQQYKNARAENLLLYNGIEYARSYPHTTGNPFVISDTFHNGSLVYDNVMYQDVRLNYDIAGNCVVIKNKDNFLVELINEKVNSFFLDDHVFVSLSVSDLPKGDMQPGIYEWYRYPQTSIFIRHQKILTRASNAADPDHFTVDNDVFIQKGDAVFRIRNSKDLMNVFADRQAAISSYLRQNRLTFKRRPEETAVKAAMYYAQLKTN